MFRKTLLALAAGVCLALSGCAGLPRERARDLVVASWNLEHLAEQDGLGCKPRVEADYAILRRYADRLDADVIAFQEVESAAAAARVFTPDRYVVVMSKRPDSARGGDCRGAPGQQIRKQDVGFAVRKGLTIRRNRDMKSLGLGDLDLRWGVDITIQGRRPLRLLNVHLKSGCSAGASAEACATLLRQSPVVERWIDERTRSGEAAIILGDFNRRLALPGDLLWRDWDDGRPRGSVLSLAGQGLTAKCDPRYRDFIDHLVLNRLAGLHLRPGSFRELPYDAGDSPRPSDHCPVSVRLKRF
jgi:endonuclease/exonuclease/phosphatase family metal-dependent hydrolase